MKSASKLVFIGGAPGVGKSEVASILLKKLDDCIWLDADNIWNMNPFVVDNRTKSMVEQNVINLLRSYLEHGFSYILFTWVLHSEHIVQRILEGLGNYDFAFEHFTLVCDEHTLRERISSDTGRGLDFDLAVRRLNQSLDVKSERVDTVGLTPDDVANRLKNRIISK